MYHVQQSRVAAAADLRRAGSADRTTTATATDTVTPAGGSSAMLITSILQVCARSYMQQSTIALNPLADSSDFENS